MNILTAATYRLKAKTADSQHREVLPFVPQSGWWFPGIRGLVPRAPCCTWLRSPGKQMYVEWLPHFSNFSRSLKPGPWEPEEALKIAQLNLSLCKWGHPGTGGKICPKMCLVVLSLGRDFVQTRSWKREEVIQRRCAEWSRHIKMPRYLSWVNRVQNNPCQ